MAGPGPGVHVLAGEQASRGAGHGDGVPAEAAVEHERGVGPSDGGHEVVERVVAAVDRAVATDREPAAGRQGDDGAAEPPVVAVVEGQRGGLAAVGLEHPDLGVTDGDVGRREAGGERAPLVGGEVPGTRGEGQAVADAGGEQPQLGAVLAPQHALGLARERGAAQGPGREVEHWCEQARPASASQAMWRSCIVADATRAAVPGAGRRRSLASFSARPRVRRRRNSRIELKEAPRRWPRAPFCSREAADADVLQTGRRRAVREGREALHAVV